MAKIKLKYAIAELGKTLYEVALNLPRQEEKTVTGRPRRSSGKSNKAQKPHHQRFTLAVAYTSAALANPEVRIQYEEMAQQGGIQPGQAAISNYRNGNDLRSMN